VLSITSCIICSIVWWCNEQDPVVSNPTSDTNFVTTWGRFDLINRSEGFGLDTGFIWHSQLTIMPFSTACHWTIWKILASVFSGQQHAWLLSNK
jgi:hypothetical protein